MFFIRLLRFEGSFEETTPAKNLEQALAQDKSLIKEATRVLCPGDGQVQAVIAAPRGLCSDCLKACHSKIKLLRSVCLIELARVHGLLGAYLLLGFLEG